MRVESAGALIRVNHARAEAASSCPYASNALVDREMPFLVIEKLAEELVFERPRNGAGIHQHARLAERLHPRTATSRVATGSPARRSAESPGEQRWHHFGHA
jgi:hypothetical protein